MGSFAGPEIVTDGLVFVYDMGNTDKSFQGAPTTNLITNPLPNGTTTGFAALGGVGTLAFDAQNQAIKWVRTSYEVWGAYHTVTPIFNGTLSTSVQYTMSFEWKVENNNFSNSVYSYELVQGNGVSPAVAVNLVTNSTLQPNGWFLFKCTFTPANAGVGDAYNRIYFPSQSTNTSTFYWRKIQFEQRAFATPFVNGTRSTTQSLLDLARKTTITMTSPTYNSNGSFSFSGGTERIDLPATIGPINNNFTISAWINSTSISSTQNILSMNGPYFMRIDGSRVRFNVLTDSWLFQAGTTTLLSNTWYFLTMVWNGTAGTWTGYINGTQEFSTAKSGSVSATNFYGYVGYTPQAGEQSNFQGQIATVYYYNRALTAAEVIQNFNAKRGRYGI
jgi:hypothetical protein